MRLEAYSATLGKKDETTGEPVLNTITVLNNKLDEENPVKIVFPAEKMQYPQFDSFAEIITDCGSETRFIEIYNEMTQKVATSAGKATIRNASVGTEDEIIEAGCRVSRTFSWKEETKLSVKDKASKFDELMQLAASGKYTAEQIAARVMELNG